MAKKKAAKKKAPAKKKSAKKKSAKKKPAAKKSMVKKAMARKSPVKKAAAKKKRPKAKKREMIDTGTDRRFAMREEQGQFQDVVDVGRSLPADIRQPAETVAPAGQGNLGN